MGMPDFDRTLPSFYMQDELRLEARKSTWQKYMLTHFLRFKLHLKMQTLFLLSLNI
jgi:hypothetical protein